MKTKHPAHTRRRRVLGAVTTLCLFPGAACDDGDDDGSQTSAFGTSSEGSDATGDDTSATGSGTAADSGTDSDADADSGSDADPSDTTASGSSDSASGSDTDSSSGTDSGPSDDSGGDTGANGNCGPYPAGPYNWYDNSVVPPDTVLPAQYGPSGPETTLTMSEVHDRCDEVKSLVFAFGANDWGACPARFGQLGTQETQIIEQNGELVGIYYQSLSGAIQPVSEASGHIDGYGWTQSWRAIDEADGTLYNAGDGAGNWLFPWTPFVFVLDTKTMTIVKTEANMQAINALAEVTAINEANP